MNDLLTTLKEKLTEFSTWIQSFFKEPVTPNPEELPASSTPTEEDGEWLKTLKGLLYPLPAKNINHLIEVIKENLPTSVFVSVYGDAVDFNYQVVNNEGEHIKYVTVYLNVAWNDTLFLSASDENVRASVPVTHIYERESTRRGPAREYLDQMCRDYFLELKNILAEQGVDMRQSPTFDYQLEFTRLQSPQILDSVPTKVLEASLNEEPPENSPIENLLETEGN